MRGFWRGLFRFPAYLVLGIATLWAVGALYYDLPTAQLRSLVAPLYGLAVFGTLICVKRFWPAIGVAALGFAAVLAWWLTIKPTENRAWQPDVARTASADIKGDEITLHEVRNFDYRTETDYTPRWETRVLHLSKLSGVDVSITYWGSAWIGHPMVSFLFSDALPVVFSVETRKVVGQSYSVIAGLYRQYELIYIPADERDLIRLRTNYRKDEEVFLYRTKVTPDDGRALFLAYLDRLNRLHEQPAFYNQITDNCTTSIRLANIEAHGGKAPPWNWRILLTGKSDELLYQRGIINQTMPFPTLKERSHINKAARAADASPDFSQLIRAGLPDPVAGR